MKVWIVALVIGIQVQMLKAQDTFSIVAVDTITGEVGSAGASCVDLFWLPDYTIDFLGELFPGKGAINTQASYTVANQVNARTRMLAGDTPQQIINWLIANDVNSTPAVRQYGIVSMVNGSPQAAAYTGANCFEYKNHIVGRNYTIQGNILSGQHILDSMEARFLREPGSLQCKLMAALQGAKSVGADTRCASNGSSSLFAFVKVAQPTDSFSAPSFLLAVKTRDGDRVEPIDSLQTLFRTTTPCANVGVRQVNAESIAIKVYPNPSTGKLQVNISGKHPVIHFSILNSVGQRVYSCSIKQNETIDLSTLDQGLYLIELTVSGSVYYQRWIKSNSK